MNEKIKKEEEKKKEEIYSLNRYRERGPRQLKVKLMPLMEVNEFINRTEKLARSESSKHLLRETQKNRKVEKGRN